VAPDEPQAEIDALYRLPLAEFTPARNALAKLRKQRGDRGGADLVRALQKPSVSAWTVNQLWWRDRALFDELLAAGDAVRSAAQRGAGPAEQQEPQQRRRRALGALVKAAEQRLQEAGHGASATTIRRITTTLEACAAFGSRLPSPGPGRLGEDLDPPGFEVLAELVGASVSGASRQAAPSVPTTPAERARPSPTERATQQIAAATARADELAAEVDVAAARADDARIDLDARVEVHERLESTAVEARRAADEAKRVADRARRVADAADQALLQARAHAEEARRELQRLRTKAAR
jgi:hypothetical protein